jgi:recombination protein RecT
MAETGRDLILKKQSAIKGYLMADSTIDQLSMALPKIGVTPERIARIAFTSIGQNPKLLDCSPESVLRSVILSAQYGLLPNGRDAHLIPYGRECQFQMDYKGLITLIRRSPKVASYVLEAAFEDDKFEIFSGSERKIVHKPNIKGNRSPEKLLCVYSLITYNNGEIDFDYMTKKEVETVRDAFSKQPDGDAWKKSFIEMAKKTVCHRHGKKADISETAYLAMKADEAAMLGENQQSVLDMGKGMLGEGEFKDLVIDTEYEEIETPEQVRENFEKAVRVASQKTGVKYKSIAKVHEYLGLIAKNKDKDPNEVMRAATKDNEGFIISYGKWLGKQDAGASQQPSQNNAPQGATPLSSEDGLITAPHLSHIKSLCGEYGIELLEVEEYFEVSTMENLSDAKYSSVVSYLNELAAQMDKDIPGLD